VLTSETACSSGVTLQITTLILGAKIYHYLSLTFRNAKWQVFVLKALL